MSNDYDWTVWQWVVGLTLVVGACIVLGSAFNLTEFLERAWRYWCIRRQLRRAAQQWRAEHGDQVGVNAIHLTLGDDADANGSRRVPEAPRPNLDVRRAESDGEDSPSARARRARD